MNTLARHTNRSKGLTKYDPHKGVKKIAVAEMAAKHYAKAKDASKLTDAIRAKLEAQAEFVLWWDTQVEKAEGGRPTKKPVPDLVRVIAGHHGLPDRNTISRWRAKLNDPDKFEQAYAEACSKYSKILEFEKGAHVEHNSGDIEWYTPAEYVEAARTVMDGIDLDPASSDEANKIVKADLIFTSETDGLKHDWSGRVWMNPPYAPSLVKRFTAKLVAHVLARELEAAVVLVNNATETLWFRAMADVADAICFKTGRIQFRAQERATATGLQGQAFLYFGDEADLFIREFARFGFVMVKP